jgi:hypothetical protein
MPFSLLRAFRSYLKIHTNKNRSYLQFGRQAVFVLTRTSCDMYVIQKWVEMFNFKDSLNSRVRYILLIHLINL